MDKIYTGFENLDKSLWIYKGNLVVFAAPQRTESLCFFCSIMENIANKFKCLFFSMETFRSNRVESLIARAMDYSKNMLVVRKIVDFDELLITVAEQKLNNDIDAVFIDNFDNLLKHKNSVILFMSPNDLTSFENKYLEAYKNKA
jgi:ribosomal protein S24E